MGSTILPKNIGFGELARLIPVVSDSNKESKATSALLATFVAVPEFARHMLSLAGYTKVNTRSKIECYTEIKFLDKNGKPAEPKGSDRPDGIIIVTTGNTSWSAIIEAKIEAAELNVPQVERYLDLARSQGIDAVITISNQFSNIPSHHPLKVNGQKTRTVGLYHWSWKSILTEAILHTDDNKEFKNIDDETQRYILLELKRFLEHKNTGVTDHAQMNKSWTRICSEGGLEKKTEDTSNAVLSWHNLCSDISLSLSKKIGINVTQTMPKKYKTEKNAYNEKLKDDVDLLFTDGTVETSFNIKDAASKLSLLANIKEKYITVSMTLRVSKDAKTAQGAIGWIRKQLKDVELNDVHVTACYAGKNTNKTCDLNTLLDIGHSALNDNNKNIPHSFEIYLKKNLKLSEIKGVKKFVEIVKVSVTEYYTFIGENLKKAQNNAPKISKEQICDKTDLVQIKVDAEVA